MASRLGYRRDIDGLRAISVLSVILYHLDFRFAKGGFLGVDVFFVISGFLITAHTVEELDAGRFSLASFYERRARRIFPALAAVLLEVSAIAYVRMMPNDLIDYAKSVLATVLSVSNFFFWLRSSYFFTFDKPLLHTWSLSLEEQFYLICPVLLLLLHRYRRRWLRPAIAVAAAGSFLLSAAMIRKYPDATFYLLPQRAWELLAGSMMGLGMVRLPRGRVAREVTAALGLLLVAGFLIRVPESWRFPGPTVFPVVLGAALLLGLGEGEEGTAVGRLLSVRPLVGIGLISYSAYLWHLPLIIFEKEDTMFVYGHVFAKVFPFLTAGQSVTLERTTLLLALSLGLGAISWRLIEQPVRFGSLRPARRVLFALSATMSALIVAGALTAVHAHGFPGRFPPEVVQIASIRDPDRATTNGICLAGTGKDFETPNCREQSTDKPNWLLLGDSHALVLDYGVTRTFPEVNLMLFGIPACGPFPSGYSGERNVCREAFHAFYFDYLPKHPFDRIILSGNWQPADVPRVGEAIAYLNSLHQSVVLVGPIMHYDAPLRFLLADSIRKNDPSLAGKHRILAYDALDAEMAKLAKEEWHVPYFSYSVLCPEGQCIVWSKKNTPLQWDQTHLLEDGSVLAAERMRASGVFPVVGSD